MGSEPRVPVFGVDMDRYRKARRWIRHVFRGASPELESLVINFAHSDEMAVPMSANHYSGSGIGYVRVKRALDLLLDGGYIEMTKNYSHGPLVKGMSRVYGTTKLFSSTFRFRLPDRLAVKREMLRISDTTEVGALPSSLSLGIVPVYLIPALSTYARLVRGIKLSLATGEQVFEDIDLRRKDGKRLYAYGTYQYQSGIPKKTRRHLLMNGEQTVELDYTALHGNLLLNREGSPSDSMFYERILAVLGLRLTSQRRKAVKELTCASFNVDNRHAFSLMANNQYNDHDSPLMGILGTRPVDLYRAIIKAHPGALCLYRRPLRLSSENG